MENHAALNHLLHPLPFCWPESAWLQLQLRTVHPVHEPVFQAMDLFVLVNECTQLVAGPTPGELPTPVSLQLVGECMRFYIVKAESFKLRVLTDLLASVATVHLCALRRSSRNLSLMLQSLFLPF